MAAKREKNDTYRDKRDFRRTPEPAGSSRSGDDGSDGKADSIFVVHQHAARSPHFDLRIEVDGELASWAVPKGPSTDPREKRLAIETEAHPLDYADFEGVIPAGEYGAGAVIVWDAGPCRNRSRDEDGEPVSLKQALARGHAEVLLEGKKLHGVWHLIHAKTGGDPDNWLFVKKDDEGADARRNPTRTEPRSVLSGRTIEEVAAEEDGDDSANE